MQRRKELLWVFFVHAVYRSWKAHLSLYHSPLIVKAEPKPGIEKKDIVSVIDLLPLSSKRTLQYIRSVRASEIL